MPVLPDIAVLADVWEREVVANVIDTVLSRRQAPGGGGPPVEIDPVFAAEDNRPRLFAITGTFFAAAVLTVVLRMYVRIRIIKTLGPDDYVMLAAMLFSTGNMICNILQTRHGWGRHFVTIPPTEFIKYRRIGFFKSQLFVLGTNCVKISIALLLMRLATLNKYRKFLWGTIIFMACFTIACLGTLIFNCNPIAGAWDPVIRKNGHCYSQENFKNIGLFNTIVNVTTDVMYATIPIPLIWQLQTTMRTRISLVLILSLGYFACAAGIVKGVKQANFMKIQDATFWEEITTWGFIQLNVGIIAACIPTLKPLFRAALDYTRGGGSGSNSRGNGRTPNGNLSYASAKNRRANRVNSIQLTALDYDQDQDAHLKSPAKVTAVAKSSYPNDNDSSDFEGQSPKESQENILPNNINQWPISSVSGNGIRMTTEVIVQTTTNENPPEVGMPKAGSFDHQDRR